MNARQNDELGPNWHPDDPGWNPDDDPTVDLADGCSCEDDTPASAPAPTRPRHAWTVIRGKGAA
jgi:hypothetical protein